MELTVSLSQTQLIMLMLMLAWVLPWKGWALWLSARNGHPWWFVVLLVVNTLAVLEIFYIYMIARKMAEDPAGDSEHDNA